MSDDSIPARTKRTIRWLRDRLLGQQVSLYPTYAYRDREDPAIWHASVRVWVHDNRDTPGVERIIERLAATYFERDLGTPLSPEEATRLEERLACFIADDKSDEEVELILPGGATPAIRLSGRTTHNGVIEEKVRIPDEYAPPAAKEGRWLTIRARTTDGLGAGEGRIQFLEAEGLSIVSDIDDTVKVTEVPAGKETVLRNVFLRRWRVAEGMCERYDRLAFEARAVGEDTSFHYVSGSPWQLYPQLNKFLAEERFPPGTFHLKNLRKNLFEPGAVESIRAFVLSSDLATLDQKIRQITQLMIDLPSRQFVLIGDSGERDPEVYRAIQRMFPHQVRRILIRDVLGERLAGMERITGIGVAVPLDTTEVEKEMHALVAAARAVG